MKTRTKATRKRPSPASSPRMDRGPSPASAHLDAGSSSQLLRRTIRPVDRQKMLDWLVAKLNKKEMPRNLRWVEEGKVFTVKWAHAARQGFKSADDACLFKAWAVHTGLYQEGDLSQDHKRWKANFRCAIHSLPDVEEIKTKDGRKGPNAARIYRILEEPRSKKAKVKNCNRPLEDEIKGEDSDSSSSSTDNQEGSQDCLPLPVASLVEAPTENSVAEEGSCNIPDFQRLGLPGLIVQQNHLSGGCVKVVEEPPTSPTIDTLSPDFFISHAPTENPVFSLSSCSSTPTSSIPVSAASPTLPPEVLEGIMRPVGTVTRSPPGRGRTPSGDSGVPGSPPLTLENWTGGVVDEAQLDFSREVIEELTVDEGIGLMLEIVPDISSGSEIKEVQYCSSVEQNGCYNWMTGELLDISHNVPMPAMMMEVTTAPGEDYQFTAMEM